MYDFVDICHSLRSLGFRFLNHLVSKNTMAAEVLLIRIEVSTTKLRWPPCWLFGCHLAHVPVTRQGSEFGRSEIRCAILEEDAFIDIFWRQGLLEGVIEFLVIKIDVFRAEKVHRLGREFEDIRMSEPVKVVLEAACDEPIGVDGLDEEHLKHLFLHKQVDFLLICELFIHVGSRPEIVPGADQHERDNMGQHAGIFDKLQGVFENVILGVDVDEPDEGREDFGVPEALAYELFEVELLDDLLELRVEGYEKADSFDDVIEIGLGICIGNLDLLEDLFEDDNEVVELVVLQKLIQIQADSAYFFALNIACSTFMLNVGWLFSAMK